MRFINLADLLQRPQEPQTVGCKPEFIENLPQNKKDGDCYICLEKLEKHKGVELPCEHAFDKACLSKWLEDNHSCPVCRAKMPQSALKQ
jgi:SWI/SNF-related matrix-associated actin-dependent regulator of chromatin subfamily A3